MRMWTREDRWMHRLTNAGLTHGLAQVYEQTTQNARKGRPLQNAPVQVPHKTSLGIKELWHRWMHWHVCITIPRTLEGTQPLFVVNSVKLHLTASNTYTYIYTVHPFSKTLLFQNMYIIYIIMPFLCLYLFCQHQKRHMHIEKKTLQVQVKSILLMSFFGIHTNMWYVYIFLK